MLTKRFRWPSKKFCPLWQWLSMKRQVAYAKADDFFTSAPVLQDDSGFWMPPNVPPHTIQTRKPYKPSLPGGIQPFLQLKKAPKTRKQLVPETCLLKKFHLSIPLSDSVHRVVLPMHSEPYAMPLLAVPIPSASPLLPHHRWLPSRTSNFVP